MRVLLSIPTDAEFVKRSSRGHDMKMEQITKRELRNFGEISLFRMIFNSDFFVLFQMTNFVFWIVGFILKYTMKKLLVRQERIDVRCVNGRNKK